MPVYGQLTAPVKNGDTTITLTGNRDSRIKMSKWRIAETPHVVVFSANSEERVRETLTSSTSIRCFLGATCAGRADDPHP